MATWSLPRLLCASLSVLLLRLPGPLGAGTPAANGTDPVTAGFYSSTAGGELGNAGSGETSTSHSTEGLSASQRNVLLTRTAAEGRAATEETQTFTEASSRSLGDIIHSTEALASALVVATTETSSRDWEDTSVTDQASGASPAGSQEASPRMSTAGEEDRLPRDGPVTVLRPGGASARAEPPHTGRTYTSTAISRAGERTLLSVTSSSSSNGTSSASTQDSSSRQPPSTWGVSARVTDTEDYTHSAPSTRTDGRDTTDQLVTRSSRGPHPETGSAGVSGGTQSLTGQLNATRRQFASAPEETSDSPPPPLGVTEPGAGPPGGSASSPAPAATSPAPVSTDPSGTAQGTAQGSGFGVTASPEPSTGAHRSSSRVQEATEGVPSQTREDNACSGPTAAPPTTTSGSSRSSSSRSSSGAASGLDMTLDSRTDTPPLVTEVSLTPTPVGVTERSQMTEEDTFKAAASTIVPTTAPVPPATSPSPSSSSASGSTPGPATEATTARSPPSTLPSTPPPTPAPLTSAARPTPGASTRQTREPSPRADDPAAAATRRAETSTGAPGFATTLGQHVTAAASTRGAPTKGTAPAQTTARQADRRSTEAAGTTPLIVAPTPPSNPCVSNPCMNGGMCVSYKGHRFICHCQQAWTGPTCNQDVDECERDPCPVGSRCVNTRGSFSCECPIGFDLEDGRTCTRAKAFLGTFSVNRLPHDPVIKSFKSETMHEMQREIIQLLNASLSVLRGYSRSTLSKKGEDGVRISAVNMFSITADVTGAEVYNSIQMSLGNCSSSLAHCRMVLHHQLSYHVESLCVAQKTPCDTERSTCADNSGTANCQCLQGYYKHNPDDLSCLDCGDGYQLENGTCLPCVFGFGGFNCGNFYKLIAIVVSPAGGALVLILVIALIVTCCKKNKNDLNKIIFKSGDLQMSPYADFPKNNRISTEWGRETIEMQENGSTKNLLQMTDIYYSPALRNSDLDRNGLYPFTGLPGSRHSCIYPAQWNPSFISDDSRRRDYF
ncbi:heg1 [Pungitius sinensis]